MADGEEVRANAEGRKVARSIRPVVLAQIGARSHVRARGTDLAPVPAGDGAGFGDRSIRRRSLGHRHVLASRSTVWSDLPMVRVTHLSPYGGGSRDCLLYTSDAAD